MCTGQNQSYKTRVLMNPSKMVQSSPQSPSQSKHLTLEIFTTQISDDDLSSITHALKRAYGTLIEICPGEPHELPSQAYHRQRNQYDADYLLRYALRQKNRDIVLWIIPHDLYISQMNFIFGLAHYFQGAVLSLFRLNSDDLKQKEAIHEIGHVLGLPHCTNTCVMHYSNSLGEAQRKPLSLCDRCKRILNI